MILFSPLSEGHKYRIYEVKVVNPLAFTKSDPGSFMDNPNEVSIASFPSLFYIIPSPGGDFLFRHLCAPPTVFIE